MNTLWGEREHKVRTLRTFSEQDGVKREDFRNTGADFVNTIIYLPYYNVMQVREIGTILLCISCSLWGSGLTWVKNLQLVDCSINNIFANTDKDY